MSCPRWDIVALEQTDKRNGRRQRRHRDEEQDAPDQEVSRQGHSLEVHGPKGDEQNT